MSTAGGPRITSDNLVLCLDAHDAKSYPGEPTDNKQPNDASSRFTSSNSWGTYQTNQYNGNTYFSIGTISSVSGNVVTTSSNHPFRTFDAVRAQTTGGGITAGTNYFINKLTNTTFTIHAYNSSQDGTQGYIRSDGYHQVHANIATDTRISINATSFPTMWHGAPHLANTAHVKELRTGGGRVKGTNAMRIHVTRTVGVDGGMSYGVNVYGATQGDTITTSWWAKSSLSSKTATYYTYWGTTDNSYNFTVTKEWQKFTHTWTAGNTYNFIQYWFQGASSTPWWMDLADIQTEINKSYSTPYVLPATDRSTTDAWKDRSGNDYHGDFAGGVNTGVSHYRKGQVIEPKSNAYIDFDGTDDYIDLGTPETLNFSGSTSATVVAWINTSSSAEGQILRTRESSKWLIFGIASGKLRANIYDGTNQANDENNNGPTVNDGSWHHVAAVFPRGGSIIFYKDGAATTGVSMSSVTGETGTPSPYAAIGRRPNSSQYFDGKIAAVQIYNTALSAAEVKNNMNTHRKRYGV